MDEEAARKAERVKALLAGYYGAGDAGAAPQPGRGGGPATAGGGAGHGKTEFRKGAAAVVATSALVTLDSPHFDAAQHMVQMLKTSSLERLMLEHRNTAREIKNLDTDMQQLVTENYHKFITATDTIRVMKTEVDKAMPDLAKLNTIMSNVSERSTTISTKLQARQDKMEELYRVQALLQKLQAVFDLPKRMRAALEEDVLDTAVSFYAEAQPLLKKYGHKGTFRQIAADSDVVAKEISQVLKRRLAERKDDTEACVLLLRKLGEPDDTLQDRYLAGRATRLRRILKDAAAVADAMAAGAVDAVVPAGSPLRVGAAAAIAAARSQLDAPPGTWGFAEDGAPPGLRQFVRALDEKVINAVQETVMNVMRFFLSKDLSPEELAIKRKPLVALAREVFVDYFAIIRRSISDSVAAAVGEASCVFAAAAAASGPEGDVHAGNLSLASQLLNIATNWGTEALAQALSTLSADLSMVSGGLPELGLRDRAASLVAGAVQHHVDACFGALQARVRATVAGLGGSLGAAGPGAARSAPGNDTTGAAASSGLLRKAYAYLVELVGRGLEALMQGFKAYEAQQRLLTTYCPDFMGGLQAALHAWFLETLSSFMSITGVKLEGVDAGVDASAKRAAAPGPAVRRVGVAGPEDQADAWKPSAQMAALLAATGLAAGPAASLPVMPPSNTDMYSRSGLVLLLAKLCSYLEQNSVPWVMECLAGFFVNVRALSVAAAANPDLPPAFIPGEVARRLAAGSSALLAAYVELHGRQLSLMVRRSVAATAWLHHKEPRGPRPVCDLLAERLARAEVEVVQLVEDSGRRTDAATALAPSAARNERGFGAGLLLETGNVERNLAKIFREKVKVFGAPVQFTQAAVLGGIAGVGLKSLVECIRLQTLGRAGLQQLQLDVHYLRPLLRRFTGGRTQQVVDSLLDEVVSAGVDRSLDPTLLEASVLDRIISAVDGS